MNEAAQQQPVSNVRPSRFPVKSILWTIAAAAIAYAVRLNIVSLNDAHNLDMAWPTWTAILAVFTTLIAWLCWSVFYLRSWLVSALILLLPIIGLTLFYPDFGGDGAVTFRPRMWDWRNADYSTVENAPSEIDLSSTTKFDFPQFLGPNRNLNTNTVQLTADWKTPPELMWKIDVGDAWSGFSVVNGYAVTQEQRGRDECVTCYDVLSGKLKWIKKAARRHEDVLAMGKVGPRATPTIHEGLVYTTGGNGILDCLDGSDGSLVWTADIPALVGISLEPRTNSLGIQFENETSTMAWGRSCSPLIYKDLVIVGAGGPATIPTDQPNPTATLIAFNKKTGEEVWRGGQRMISYGSPNVATIDGKDQIVLISEAHAVGHDPQSGVELWSHQRDGASNAGANCSQVTVLGNNRLLLSKGYQMGGEIIRLQAADGNHDGDRYTVESLGKHPRMLKTKMTNPVIVDGHAIALSDGFVSCVQLLDEKPGLKKKWNLRSRYGNGQLLAVGDKFLIHGEDGVLVLAQINFDKFEKLGQFKTIEGFCWNTIALYGDLVLVRSEQQAACYRLPVKNGPIIEQQNDPPSDTNVALQ